MIKVGMTRAEAERVMTAGQLMCSRLNLSEPGQKWEPCEGRASETAERLQWVHSAALAGRPNICSVELDAEQRVAETEYARPDYHQ